MVSRMELYYKGRWSSRYPCKIHESSINISFIDSLGTSKTYKIIKYNLFSEPYNDLIIIIDDDDLTTTLSTQLDRVINIL